MAGEIKDKIGGRKDKKWQVSYGEDPLSQYRHTAI